MLDSRVLSALIAAVYEAGLDPTGAGWPAVLERLSPVLAAGGTVVLSMEHRRMEYAHTYYARTDMAAVASYQGYYARIDPVFEPLLASAPAGILLLSDVVMPLPELRRTEFYADWMRPHDFGSGATAVLTRHGSTMAALWAIRPRRTAALTAEHVEAFRLLLPHMAIAVRMSLRLAELGAERDAAAQALDHWADAVLLVDGAARVHAANRAAEALLASGDGLDIGPTRDHKRGRLRAATPTATAKLHQRVAEAAAIAAPAGVQAGDQPPPRSMALALVRPSGRPALSVLVAPLSSARIASAGWIESLTAGGSGATVALLVSDPAAACDGAVAGARLRAVYGLTPAEASVAVAVASGDGLLAVAAAHGVTLATVRTQARRCIARPECLARPVSRDSSSGSLTRADCGASAHATGSPFASSPAAS